MSLMKVAIIGAGFAGLATAYFLQEFEGIHVTIFEKTGIGAGASGAASGLLHPYPGIMARRSRYAEEALRVSKELLRVAEANTPQMVSTHAGILRRSLNEEQHTMLQSHCDAYGDIEQVDDSLFLIHTGITVLSSNYLRGLSAAIEKRGAEIRIEEVSALSELGDFDHIVVAAGFGIRDFEECSHLKVKFLKGQALRLQGTPHCERSLISKGYLAHLGSESFFEIGSTYERVFENPHPNLEVAKELLADKLKETSDAVILECKAGIRVCPQNHYLPIVEKIGENATVFTGLGSRGLLYHAYFGRKVAGHIAQNAVIS